MATGTSKKAPPIPGKVPLTFAAMRERIKRPQRIVPLVMDTEAFAQIDALETLLERVQRQDEAAGTSLAPEVARQLQTVEDAAWGSVAEVTLQAISHTDYQKLRKVHPPTAEQMAAAEALNSRAAFNDETFCPALVLAQMLIPQAPGAEDWQVFWDDLSDGQMNQLWTSALAVQMQTVQLGSRSQNAAAALRELGLPD